jgi:hypothetical protein
MSISTIILDENEICDADADAAYIAEHIISQSEEEDEVSYNFKEEVL